MIKDKVGRIAREKASLESRIARLKGEWNALEYPLMKIYRGGEDNLFIRYDEQGSLIISASRTKIILNQEEIPKLLKFVIDEQGLPEDQKEGNN